MTLEDFFLTIEKQFLNKLPFIAYRKPNEIKIKSLLQKDDTIHFLSDFEESGFLFAPFDDTEEAVLIPFFESKLIESQFVIANEKIHSDREDIDLSGQKQFHINLVKKAIDAIKKEHFQKVVLSRKELITIDDPNPVHIFKKLLNSYESAFVYCWYHPKVGLWLGATPETFLTIEGNRIKTMALAGTQKFSGSVDVIWQSKEKEEQQIVTNYIIDNLKSSVNNLRISEVQTIKAGNILHLKTEISANFDHETFNFKQIIKKLHPTPAVCGLPRNKAQHFILNNEGYRREFYTGFLGELNFKEKKSRNTNRHNIENDAYASVKTISNLYVNLRCLQLVNNTAIIYVGGGITKDSIPENEWEETVSKSKVIKSVL
jgi:isochorismate synthase